MYRKKCVYDSPQLILDNNYFDGIRIEKKDFKKIVKCIFSIKQEMQRLTLLKIMSYICYIFSEIVFKVCMVCCLALFDMSSSSVFGKGIDFSAFKQNY